MEFWLAFIIRIITVCPQSINLVSIFHANALLLLLRGSLIETVPMACALCLDYLMPI